MKNHISNAKGLALIGVVIVLVILLVVTGLVFALDLPKWEGEIWNSLGMPPQKGRLAASIYLFILFILKVMSGRKIRKVRKHKKLKLPS